MQNLTPSEEVVETLAPSGTLNAAINLSNFLLVSEVLDDGTPVGVSPDLSAALAGKLGVPIEFITYKNPGELADSVWEWDTGNIGAEPQRAKHISFTAAYAEIEGTYLVPPDSPIKTLADVDQPGRRVAVKSRAAYCLWLERHLKHAELVQTDSHDSAFRHFVDEGLDALAGLRPKMMSDGEQLPGSSVLPGYFMTVQQAIGTPLERNPVGAEYLAEFVEEAKRSGFVGELIAKHGVVGLSVAPPVQR